MNRRSFLKVLAAIPFVGIPLAAAAERKVFGMYRAPALLHEWEPVPQEDMDAFVSSVDWSDGPG